MGVLANRVKSTNFICKIHFHFSGNVKPKVINTNHPFYDNEEIDLLYHDDYFTKGSFSFSEKQSKNSAGTYYLQKIIFNTTIGDNNRSERISLLNKVRFVTIELTDGRKMTIGRNDYKQNKPPNISIESNLNNCSCSITNRSIFGTR